MHSRKLFSLVFALVSSSLLIAADTKVAAWGRVRTVIPGFYFEYSIPSTLTPGYRPALPEVVFDRPETDDAAFRFGQSAYEKKIATYFYGVVGDFKDYDMTVAVSVLQFDERAPVKSADELRDYVRQVLSEKLLLKNGTEVAELGAVSVEKMGAREVVEVSAADMYHVADVSLRSGMVVTRQPWRHYFIRLNDRVGVVVRTMHFTPKKLTPKWYENADALVREMIERMKFLPKG